MGSFWHFLELFDHFFWPIFIPGQFEISPYSNIFWLVHLCDFGTFCTNLVALFGEFLPNLVTLFAQSGSTFWPHQLFTVHGSTSLNSLLTVLIRWNVFWLFLAFFGTFLAIVWPILILGQFVITPYSNIFCLVQRFRSR